MKLDKFSIDIEKIGEAEVFSYNGFILGYRGKRFNREIFFFPIVINENILRENKNLLNTYLDFIDMANHYNEEQYSPIYDIYFKAYDKIYEDRTRYEIVELLDLSSNTGINTDITIFPKDSGRIHHLAEELLIEISSLDKRFNFKSVCYDKTKTFSKSLFINKHDYVKISIDLFGNWSISHFNSCNKEEKTIKEIAGIINHVLKMLDKNLGKATIK